MSLIDAIADYREPTTKGVSIYRKPGDHSVDNAVLFSAIYIILLMRLARDQMQNDALKVAMEVGWFEDFIESCRQKNGLLVRYPKDTGHEAPDDYIGAVAALYAVSDHSTILQWYSWGLTHDFTYDNVDPEKFSIEQCFGRFPDFAPFMKAAAGDSLNILDQFRACSAFLWSAWWDSETDTTSIILNWCKVQVLRGRYSLVDAAIRFWQQRWMRVYPTGMQSVFAVYFHPEHPFVDYGPKDMS